MLKRLTLDEIQTKIASRPLICLSQIYVNCHTKLKWQCLKCRWIWEATTDKVLNQKTGCPKCGGKCINISEIKKELKQRKIALLASSYVTAKTKMLCECLKCGNRWSANANKLISQKTGCPKCAMQRRIEVLKTLNKESKVEINFLNTFEGWCKDRKILNGKELDAYFEKEKLAIEINGCFWHSTLHKRIDKSYHLDKTNLCEQKGIKLLHFWDFEINENFDFCKQIVLENLYALDDLEYFKIKEIKPLHFELFDSNDIKHSNLYLKHIGSNTYEITEFSGPNKQNLYNFFVSEYKPNKIIAKLNRRFHSLLDNYALNLGFKLRKITKPSYFKYHQEKRYPKNYSKNYAKCYDCGKLVYVKEV